MRCRLLIIWSLFFFVVNAQNERSIARKANKLYADSLYVESEVMYKKSLSNNDNFNEAKFNLSDALFKQNRYDESINLLKDVISHTSDSVLKSEAYYNLGNNYLQQKKLEEAIDSYKKSLLINPSDEEARYNLAKSVSLLDNQKNENQDEEKDENENNDQEEKQNSGQTDSQDDEQENNQNQNNDQENDGQNSSSSSGNEEKNQEEDSFESQENEDKLSKEDMLRILEALDREERKVQEKMKKTNLSDKRIKTEKDW